MIVKACFYRKYAIFVSNKLFLHIKVSPSAQEKCRKDAEEGSIPPKIFRVGVKSGGCSGLSYV